MAGFNLKGERIELVLLEREHLNKRVEFLNDPEVQKTLNFDYPTSIAKTEAWFSKNILNSNRVDFAFVLSATLDIIGFGGFININYRAKKAELYIFIGEKACWGQGFGRDGYKLLVNYAFGELGLDRIYLYQLAENSRAIKATESLGWFTEGLLRNDIWSHGELKDQYLLSFLRSEWVNSDFYKTV